jgi:2,4-dienoyl-CoA reductase-like NADH-dependent reductase (Old Yellow Enzyme family)
MENRTLFDSYHLKALSLKNRIVMAPMTRARALQPETFLPHLWRRITSSAPARV